MLTYKDFKITTRTLVAELMNHSRKCLNDNGDIVWCAGGAALTTLTAAKLCDEYDEVDGFRIYDIEVVQDEEWYTRETAAEQRASKADYDLDNALDR